MGHNKLYFASIGGNPCEPIRVMFDARNQPREWYSIGCQDAHPITDSIDLVKEIIDIPLSKKEVEIQQAKWDKENKNKSIFTRPLGYRKFD